MVFTFLAAQGHEVGDVACSRQDQIDTGQAATSRRREERGVEIVLPVDVVVADRVRRRRASTTVVAADAIPAGWMGLDIGPSRRAVRRQARRRQDRVLERPDGRLRVRAVRRRHPAVAAGARPQCDGASPSSAVATPPPRCARSASTRPASATSRPVAARASSSSRARRSPASPSWRTDRMATGRTAAHGGQLEDEPQPPRGHRTVQKLAFDAQTEQDFDARRGRGAAAVHRPAHGADARRRRQARARATARRTSRPHDAGAYTGEISRRDAGQARLHLRRGRPLASAASTTSETDELVNAKVKAALRHGLTPILCVGEGLEVREAGDARRAHARPARRRARRASRPSRPRRSSSPTSRSGRSAPARSPRRRTRRRSAARSAPGSPSCTARDVADGVRILYGGSVKSGNVAGDHGPARRRRRAGRRREPGRRRVRRDRAASATARRPRLG